MYPDIHLGISPLIQKEAHARREKNSEQEPVSQKFRNLSGLFRVPQFPLYLRNAEAISHQTSLSFWFFLH